MLGCGGEELVTIAVPTGTQLPAKSGCETERTRRARPTGPRMVAQRRKIDGAMKRSRQRLVLVIASALLGACASAIAVIRSRRRHRSSRQERRRQKRVPVKSRRAHGGRTANHCLRWWCANRRSSCFARAGQPGAQTQVATKNYPVGGFVDRTRVAQSSRIIRCCGSSWARCASPRATTCRRRTWGARRCRCPGTRRARNRPRGR